MLTCFGFGKGIYDANIWASLFDVVPVSHRGKAVGTMNMMGWMGGFVANYSLGALVHRKYITMSQGIGATALIYASIFFLLCFVGFVTAKRDVILDAASAAEEEETLTH